MQIVHEDPIIDVSLSKIAAGDFFRYANGNDTEKVFVALSLGKEGYNNYVEALDCGANKRYKLWISGRTRRVIRLIVRKIHVSDTGGHEADIDDPDLTISEDLENAPMPMTAGK